MNCLERIVCILSVMGLFLNGCSAMAEFSGYTVVCDPVDQIKSFQSLTELPVSYHYDQKGNLKAGPGSLIVNYDYENRPAAIEWDGIVSAYSYNGLGDRVLRCVGDECSREIPDYGNGLKNTLMEKMSEGVVQRYYLWGVGLIGHVDVNPDTGKETVVYYHGNEVGSTLALTDEEGQVTDTYAYTPYGEVSNHEGQTETSYMYNGGLGVRHEGDGIYHMKARYYSARLKRFLSRDPLGLDGEHNLYAFADGNPVSFMDPFGLCAEFYANSYRNSQFAQWGFNEIDLPKIDTGVLGEARSITGYGSTYLDLDDNDIDGYWRDNGSIRLNHGDIGRRLSVDEANQIAIDCVSDIFDQVQAVMGVAGLYPLYGDLVDMGSAVISSLRGDQLSAALFVFAMTEQPGGYMAGVEGVRRIMGNIAKRQARMGASIQKTIKAASFADMLDETAAAGRYLHDESVHNYRLIQYGEYDEMYVACRKVNGNIGSISMSPADSKRLDELQKMLDLGELSMTAQDQIVDEIHAINDRYIKTDSEFHRVLEGMDYAKAEELANQYGFSKIRRSLSSKVPDEMSLESATLSTHRALYLPDMKQTTQDISAGWDDALTLVGGGARAKTVNSGDVNLTFYHPSVLDAEHPNLTHTIVHEEIESRYLLRGKQASEEAIESIVDRYFQMRYRKDPKLWGDTFWQDEYSGYKYKIRLKP